jgi:LuxR family maltose regulon positive regulatory protein
MAAWRARIWIIQGKANEAMRWVHDRGISLEEDISIEYRSEHLILARVLLAQERWDEALSLIQRFFELEELQEYVPFEIELHVLHALVFQGLGNRDQSLLSLKSALDLAKPRGFHQIFIDEGPPMVSLLYEALSECIEPEYVQSLLVSFSDAEPEIPPEKLTRTDQSGLIEPLSDRELEVLELIAKGLTNQVIADRLVLSLHTVKTHTRNIYGKLDVHNRTEAVDRARSLGILSPL